MSNTATETAADLNANQKAWLAALGFVVSSSKAHGGIALTRALPSAAGNAGRFYVAEETRGAGRFFADWTSEGVTTRQRLGSLRSVLRFVARFK